jgi:predicted enzyme related to lactoylglutathione lyase
LRHAGKLVAGLEGIRMEGQVPAWLGYVKVDDVRATAGKVGEAGGTVLDGPLEVPGGAGSLAVCQDPDGAVFALWQPGELRGAELVNEPGAWTWTADQAVEKTKAAGGSLIYGPVDLPIARMAVAFDPQGANVSLLESRYPEPR